MAWHVGWAWLGLLLAWQTPPTTPGEPELLPVPPRPASVVELPGSATVIGDDITNALHALKPGAVILTPEHYRQLLEQARAKEAQGGAELSPLMSACRFSGQAERDAAGSEFLRLQITLEFRTQQANTLVPLGFKGVRFSAAKLDGEAPAWGGDAERLAVLVPEAKTHTLTLEALLPVTRQGLDRRVSVERVPSAAITTLELTLLEAAQSAVLKGGGPLRVQAGPERRARLHSDALGVLTEFDLTWQPEASTAGTPRATITGDLRIFPDLGIIHTEARVRVEARSGSSRTLVFRFAADATPLDVVTLERADDPRGSEVEWTWQKNERTLTVNLKQALAAAGTHVNLLLRWRQPPPAKPEVPVLLGQLELLQPEAASQTGQIGVWPTAGVRLQFKHDLQATSPHDAPGTEPRGMGHAFRYWQQPVKLQAVIDPTPPPPLLIEVRGVHTLRQLGNALLLASEFEVAPKPGAAVQELDVRWPAGFSLDRRIVLTNLVENLEFADNTARLRLAGRHQDRFTFKLEGVFPLPAEQHAVVVLPVVVQARVERGGKISPVQILSRAGELSLIPGDLEWRLREGTHGLRRDGERALELESPLRGPAMFQVEAVPTPEAVRLAMAWQPRRTEVSGEARVFLTRQELQLEQVLRCRVPAAPPAQLWLRVPRGLEKGLRVRLRWQRRDARTETLEAALGEHARQSSPAMSERACLLPPNCPEEIDILLDYRGPRPALEAGDLTSVSLVAPSPGEVLERSAHVHVWAGDGIRLERRPDDSAWLLLARPYTDSEGAPPALALQGPMLENPLVLRASSEEIGAPSVLAERALLDVRMLPEGRLDYRFSVWLDRVRAEAIRVALPGTVRGVTVQSVRLFGRAVAVEGLDMVPHPERAGYVLVRLPLEPAAMARRGLLEIRFRLIQVRSSWLGSPLRWPAPQLDGVDGIGQTRWAMETSAGSLALVYGQDAQAEQSYRWWIWLRAPEAALLGPQLRSWLGAADDYPVNESDRAACSYVQHGDIRTLQVVLVSRQVWLVICSLFLLLPGLGLYAHRPRHFGWGALLASLLLLAVGMLRPALVPALVYGMQPGLLVMAGVIGLMWLWHRRWRSQVVLMPGFRRVSGGSSLLRPALPRSTREPSTVEPLKLPGPVREPSP